MLRRFGGFVGLLAIVLVLIRPGAAEGQGRRWLADPPLLRLSGAQQQIEDRIYDIEMLDGASGWAATGSGLLRYDGRAWRREPVFEGYSYSWLALDFSGPNNGWAVGVETTGSRIMMAAARYDGREWTLARDIAENGGILRDITVFGDGTALAVGEAYALRSSTPMHRVFRFDGAGWSQVALPVESFGTNGMLTSLSMVGPGEGWAGGIFGYAGESGAAALRPVILRLKDGRWTEEALPELGRATVRKIVMKDAGEGWAIASEDISIHQDSQLLRYKDGAWSLDTAVPTAGCVVRSIGLIPGTGRGWVSLVRCPDGRERRLRMENGAFSEDTGGAQFAPEAYALAGDAVQWGAHGGMLMRFSAEALPTARVAEGGERYFPQTGHTLGGAFKAYYEGHGLDLGHPGVSADESLALFGYPLSEPFEEINPDTGELLRVQYFERARFEWHPENPDPYKVLLGRFGFTTLLRRGTTAVIPNPNQAPSGPGCRVYTETGYSLCAPFLGYWQRNGGLPVFGFPITATDAEVSQTDGASYTTVWTERERLEHHPENAGTPYEILLGLLGAEDLRARGYLE
ncbi:MAG TPA: hypothetical protein VD886_02300 [Herpetosiphonaceae bacterium]|nr:hypothetical protein [Herpetosiphonaceae bacterium]